MNNFSRSSTKWNSLDRENCMHDNRYVKQEFKFFVRRDWQVLTSCHDNCPVYGKVINRMLAFFGLLILIQDPRLIKLSHKIPGSYEIIHVRYANLPKFFKEFHFPLLIYVIRSPFFWNTHDKHSYWHTNRYQLFELIIRKLRVYTIARVSSSTHK